MLNVEQWAEIRRLHRSEGVSGREIARRLDVSRNTVAKALESDTPPRYVRAKMPTVVTPFEPAIRAILAETPRMTSPEIAARINWPYSSAPLKRFLTKVRPEYLGKDPTDRTVYYPGRIGQCDLWFPPVQIPVAPGQEAVLPVLAMTLGYSKVTSAVMIPTRQTGDLLAGTWQILEGWGRSPKTLVWDREAGIGGKGRPVTEVAAFVGCLGVKLSLAPPRDPEYKGMIERRNRYFETSFLPGRNFDSPHDFNRQLACWLTETANPRRMRVLKASPNEKFAEDYEAMVDLPQTAPSVGVTNRVRLGRDYYVRISSNDYSVDPRFIGKHVDVRAGIELVEISCDGELITLHERCWGREEVVTDPEHRMIAKQLRADFQQTRQQRATRTHADGHVVAIRALTDYDAVFGVHFDPDQHRESSLELA